MSNDVTLTAKWARQPVSAGTPQVAYLLIDAQAQAQAAAAVAPITFCMVLDRSGSMDGAKIDSLKRAVVEVIETLRPEDSVSVVVFDETAEVVLPMPPATDRYELNHRVEAIRVQGGTAMSTGLELAIAQLQQNLSADRTAYLLLLTDGQTWGDEDDCRAYAATLAQLGVRSRRSVWATNGTKSCSTTWRRRPAARRTMSADPKDIDKYFQARRRAARNTAVRNGRLLMRLAQSVSPRAVYRVTPMIENLGYKPIGEREVNIDLGDVESGAGASVLVELMLPAYAAGTQRVAKAELYYDVPQEKRLDQHVRVEACLEFTADRPR